MLPKIVVIHFLGLIILSPRFTEWCKTLNSKANSNIFGEFWKCKRVLSISFQNCPQCPTLGTLKWHFHWEQLTETAFILPKVPKHVGIGFWITHFAPFGDLFCKFSKKYCSLVRFSNWLGLGNLTRCSPGLEVVEPQYVVASWKFQCWICCTPYYY